MRGGEIFLAFFVFFTLATLAVPIPLSPGNIVHSVFSSLGISVSIYDRLLDAVANGIFYGFIIWIASVLVSKKLEESETVINPRGNACSSEDSVHCPVSFGYLRKLPPKSSIPEDCYSCLRIEQCASD